MVTLAITDQVTESLPALGVSLERMLQESTLTAQAAQLLVDEIRASVRATFKNQSGALEESWVVRFIREGGRQKPAAISESVYARIQNEGGTILPRIAKNLAIPLPGSGVQRGQGPRDFPDLVFIKSKKGNKLLARVSKGKIKPMFVLKDRVRLNGTGYLNRAVAAAGPEIEKLLERGIEIAIAEEGF